MADSSPLAYWAKSNRASSGTAQKKSKVISVGGGLSRWSGARTPQDDSWLAQETAKADNMAAEYQALGETPQSGASPIGFLTGALGLLDRPRAVVEGLGTGIAHQIGTTLEANGISNGLDEWTADPTYDTFNQGDDNKQGTEGIGSFFDDTLGRGWRGLSGQTSYGTGDFKQGFLRYQDTDNPLMRIGKAVGTFAVDTLSDPLTYATFGAGAVAKPLLTRGLKGVAETLVGGLGVEEAATIAARNVDHAARVAGGTADMSVDSLKKVASEQIWNEAATAYERHGARGLKNYLYNSPEISKAKADEIYQSLDPGLKGGVRFNIPFTEKQSNPLIPSGTIDKLGGGRLADWAGDKRVWANAKNPVSKFWRDKMSGGTGSVRQGVLEQIQAGKIGDFAKYEETRIIDRNGRVLGGKLGKKRKQVMQGLTARINKADDPAALKQEIDALVVSGGTAEVSDEARNIFEHMILRPIQEAHAEALKNGAAIGTLEDFDIPRILKKEFRDKNYAPVAREQFAKYEDTPEGVVKSWQSLAEANNAAGQDIFETDILKILPAYLDSMHRRAVSGSVLSNFAKAGLISTTGIDQATKNWVRGPQQDAAARALNAVGELQQQVAKADTGLGSRISGELEVILEGRSPAEFAAELRTVPHEEAQVAVDSLLSRLSDVLDRGDSALYGLSESYTAPMEALRVAEDAAKSADRIQLERVRALANAIPGVKKYLREFSEEERAVQKEDLAGFRESALADINDVGSDLSEAGLAKEDARAAWADSRDARGDAEIDRDLFVADLTGELRSAKDNLKTFIPNHQETLAAAVEAGDKEAVRLYKDVLKSIDKRVKDINAQERDLRGAFKMATRETRKLKEELDQKVSNASDDVAGARQAYSNAVDAEADLKSQIAELRSQLKDETEHRRTVMAARNLAIKDTGKEAHAAVSAELGRELVARNETLAARQAATQARKDGYQDFVAHRKASKGQRSELSSAIKKLRASAASLQGSLGQQHLSRTALKEWTEANGHEVLSASSGRYVGGSPFNDKTTADALIVPALEDMFRRRSDSELSKLADKFIRPYMTWWKMMSTVMRGPGYIARNVEGGIWNHIMIGGSVGDMKLSVTVSRATAKAEKEANKVLDQGDDAWEKRFDEVMREELGSHTLKTADGDVSLYDAAAAARDHGLYQNNRTLDEQGVDLRDPATQTGTVQNVEGVGHQQVNAFFRTKDVDELNLAQRAVNRTMNNWWGYKMSDAAQSSENYLRMASFLTGVRKGGLGDGGEYASILMKSSQFDYGDLSNFEQEVVKTLVPFYTWSRNNVPLQFRALMSNPRYFLAMNRGQESVKGVLGSDDPEADTINSQLQEFATNKFGFATKISPFGSPLTLGVESPANDLNTWFAWSANPLEQANRAGMTLAGGANPVVKAAVEAGTNTDTFTKTPFGEDGVAAPAWAQLMGISHENYRGDQRVGAFVGNTLQDAVPMLGMADSLLGEPALAGARKLGDFTGNGYLAGQGANAFNENSRWASKVGSWFGVPVTTATESQRAAEVSGRNDVNSANLDSMYVEKNVDKDKLRAFLPSNPTPQQLEIARQMVERGYFSRGAA